MVRPAALAPAMALALAACGSAAEEREGPAAEGMAASATATSGHAGARPPAFAQCVACHTVEPGRNRIGPTLAGVYGARAGHVPDYAYSAGMRGSGLVWDDATLDRFLATPRKTVPGTKMAYAGLSDPAQRQAMIAYLKTL